MPRVPRSSLVRLAAPPDAVVSAAVEQLGAVPGPDGTFVVAAPSDTQPAIVLTLAHPSGPGRHRGRDRGGRLDRHPFLRLVLPAARRGRAPPRPGACRRDPPGRARRSPGTEPAQDRGRTCRRSRSPRTSRPSSRPRRLRPRSSPSRPRSSDSSTSPISAQLRRLRRDHRRRPRPDPSRGLVRALRDRDRRPAGPPAIDPDRCRRFGDRVRVLRGRAEPHRLHLRAGAPARSRRHDRDRRVPRRRRGSSRRRPRLRGVDARTRGRIRILLLRRHIAARRSRLVGLAYSVRARRR